MKIFIIPLLLGIVTILIKRWIDYRRQQLGNITRREYESKAASYLRQKGFKNVSIGKGSQDGGRDVKGTYQGRIRIGQCKMFKPPKKVGVKAVRELKGIVPSRNGKGIFFTTNGYTKSAQSFARRTGIECVVLPKWKIFKK